MYRPGLPNREYWQLRSEEVIDERWRQADVFESELAKVYRQTLKGILEDLDEVLKEPEAPLTLPQGVKLQERLERLVRLSKKQPLPLAYQNELDAIRRRFKVDRLQMMHALIEARLLDLFGNVQTSMEAYLGGIYSTQYEETYAMLMEGGATVRGFVALPEMAVSAAVVEPWSGQQFSSRIWSNKNALVKKMNDVISTGIAEGQSVQKMARALRKPMNQNVYNAKRLVQTETAHVVTRGTLKGYRAAGLTRYRFLATQDELTSTVCGNLDGKVFDIAEARPGTNCPPLHPHCRSAITPEFD